MKLAHEGVYTVDGSRWDLPAALSFLYYPLHFSRLFLKWGVRPDRKFLDD